jgi:hypothetical protein
MRFRIPQGWLIGFLRAVFREIAELEDHEFDEHDIEMFIYEAGGRGWDEDDDNEFWYIESEDD